MSDFMVLKNTIIRKTIASHQPSRVIARSIRNLFFPQLRQINRTIFVEVSSNCNARCIFCNYRFGYRKIGTMEIEDFKKIAESCKQLGYENLNLTTLGEVFTHKYAVEIMRIVKNAGFERNHIMTNGVLIHKHDIEGLLMSGIDRISISFPGFSENLYEEIFQIKKFGDFKKSIMMLLKTHRKMNSRVRIEFLPRTYLTKREILESKFFRDYVLEYVGDLVYIDDPIYVYDTLGGEIDLIKGMKGDITPLKSLYPLKKSYLCLKMLRFAVLANKYVRFCNCRYDSTIGTPEDSLYIGNLENYKDLDEFMVENRAKIDKMRTEFINGNMPKLCRKCQMYTPVSFKVYRDYVKNENVGNHLS